MVVVPSGSTCRASAAGVTRFQGCAWGSMYPGTRVRPLALISSVRGPTMSSRGPTYAIRSPRIATPAGYTSPV
jgi:hypothetical protein